MRGGNSYKPSAELFAQSVPFYTLSPLVALAGGMPHNCWFVLFVWLSTHEIIDHGVNHPRKGRRHERRAAPEQSTGSRSEYRRSFYLYRPKRLQNYDETACVGCLSHFSMLILGF